MGPKVKTAGKFNKFGPTWGTSNGRRESFAPKKRISDENCLVLDPGSFRGEAVPESSMHKQIAFAMEC